MNKADQAAKRLMATAYHEAGHAVVGQQLELEVISVSVVATDDCAGVVRHKDPKWFDLNTLQSGVEPRAHDRIERHIQALFAGHLAETDHTGRRNHIGAGGDEEKSWIWAMIACGDSSKEADAFLKWLKQRAANRLKTRNCKIQVEAVARELQIRKVMTSVELRQVMSESIMAANEAEANAREDKAREGKAREDKGHDPRQ